MMRIIWSLYRGSKAAVWDGNIISDWFLTQSGVKQGCVLSLLLFTLFLDDLVNFLNGGIMIDGMQIKVLMYADDVVLFAESPRALQLMINRLNDYCNTWNLEVNIAKTKIIILKKFARRLACDEKWYINGKLLEVVKTYKYLGVWITYNATFETHINKRLKESKLAINSTWRRALGNDTVALSVKYKVFQATVNSIMNYASHVWGFEKYNEVEKLLTYFIKRIFRLPVNTPDYAIYLETGLSTLHIGTLKSHFQYINAVMKHTDSRLTKRLATYFLGRRSSYFAAWLNLAEEHEENLNLEDMNGWIDWQQRILLKQDQSDRDRFVYKAKTSYSRQTYRELTYNLGKMNYFNDKYTVENIRSIFKSRTELIKLNYLPYVSGALSVCSLCNKQETENVKHFLAICPILKEIRYKYFGKTTLSQTELHGILNGMNWLNLCAYLNQAIKYRQQIIDEIF
ncbi:uncharacterized protein LOC119675169 [Teleopsis dalmanni]|uniref:uncharacterized protein LOC119675169 n=1 Tax=Teleopsis dalmanni TaxID=139649 RepID=UPI0018CD90E0|nr:uncharacterized protein LOC119675169 [Teleopsis dalmanni]